MSRPVAKDFFLQNLVVRTEEDDKKTLADMTDEEKSQSYICVPVDDKTGNGYSNLPVHIAKYERYSTADPNIKIVDNRNIEVNGGV